MNSTLGSVVPLAMLYIKFLAFYEKAWRQEKNSTNFNSKNVWGRFPNGRLYVWASKALWTLCCCGAKKLLHIRHMCGSCGSFLQLLFAPLWHPSLSKPGVRSGQQGENRWQLMQIGKYGNNFFWKYFPLKVLFARTRNFLIKPKLRADSKSNAKKKKIDIFASMVLVTQISGSAALDAIIDDSDCRGPLWDLITGDRF